ncbi:MAG: alanine racemase, partial [Actinobacteria bacterium]|nr:alanine racemase [Actinomycetota bacterium]
MSGIKLTMTRAQIEVDLSAIAANVRKVIKETKVDVCAVVKADAYGHGLVPIAQAATDAGAKWLGVALLEEAITLRTHGLSIPIIAWLTPLTEDFDNALRHDIDLGISSLSLLEKVMAAGERTGITPRIHVEVDTGMTRGGVLNEWPVFLKKVSAATLSEKVKLIGFFSHFARADEPDKIENEFQLKKFTELLFELKATGVTPKYLHLANSAAALSNPSVSFDFVRLGIAMYGLSPDVKTMGSSKTLGLIPAMTLR